MGLQQGDQLGDYTIIQMRDDGGLDQSGSVEIEKSWILTYFKSSANCISWHIQCGV